MNTGIHQALRLLEAELASGCDFESFGDIMRIKEVVARLETHAAAGRERRDLERAGASRSEAYRIHRRATYWWNKDVPVEHQDLILSALERLTPSSDRRTDIYQAAATAALESSPKQTHEFTKKLVREENQRLATNPNEAYRQRRFSMRDQDEHGGCAFSGYAPAPVAALFKSLLDQAFRGDQKRQDTSEDKRTIAQRQADAFEQVIRWASSDRRTVNGHCSLVVSVTQWDEFDWRARFSSNVGIDLSLMEIDYLSDDKITDYIVVHDHKGAVKSLVTAERSANFYLRIALFARDGVCQHPGCGEPASRCDSHHVIPWKRGGPTSVDNLALLCKHHHCGNDDSWVEAHLEMQLGRAVLVLPDGTYLRNTSPAARNSGGNRVNDPPQ